MATGMTWTFDTPSGVYKNHALSEEYFKQAIARTRFFEHVSIKPAFGKKQGESVTIPLVPALAEPSSAQLSENSNMPELPFTTKVQTVIVREFGQAVPYSGLIEDLDHYDPEDWISARLVDQQKLVLDASAATAFKQAAVVMTPTGQASVTTSTSGSAGAQATTNLNFFLIETARDYLVGTLLAPGVKDETDYVCIGTTFGLRGLKRDPLFIGWAAYKDPERKWNGEVGQIEDVTFVETNHATALTNTFPNAGANVMGEAVIFGREAVAFVEAVAPELRAGIPTDLGRQRLIGWYGVYGFQLLWTSALAGEGKVIHFAST
jgi:N4-gp56 family major capsid protein